MIGRLLGLIVGLAIAAVGYGVWKPVEFAKYIPPKYLDLSHFPLGPYEQYKVIVVGLTMALGLAVALAALQRPTRSKSTRPVPTLFMSAEGDHAPAHDPFSIAPAASHGDDHGHAAAHDDHGHDAPAHDDHGHDDHGHAAAHDDHGHDDHGHAAPDDHGHDDHGHDDHGHGGHGAHAPAHH